MTTKKTTTAIQPIVHGEVVPLTSTEHLPICRDALEQIKYLTLDTPPKFIKKRVGRGGKVYDYIETSYVIGRLNAIFNFNWNLETVWHEVDKVEKQVAVRVRLTVKFVDGKEVVKEAFGSSEVKMNKTGDQVDLADDLKAAQSDGMKKAASLLGIGWDVYSGLAKAAPESCDTDEEDDFLANPKPQQEHTTAPIEDDQDRFRTINLQLANGRRVQVSKYEALGYFGKLKDALGEDAYRAVLKLNGYNKSNEVPPDKIPTMYKVLVDAFRSKTKIAPKPAADDHDHEGKDLVNDMMPSQD
jgi:hypothetical protein